MKLVRVVCGLDKTFAIDDSGRLFFWGKGGGVFPELVKFFADNRIVLVDVAVLVERNLRNFPGTHNSHQSDLPRGTVMYLSDVGEVYWSHNESPTPKKFDPISDRFITSIALSEVTALFLDDQGQVYSAYSLPLS